MKNNVDARIGNYVVFSTKQIILPKQDEKKYFQGFWQMSFDGTCSNSENGACIVFKSPQYGIYPHAIILEFSCTNNDEEYEALIQGMILSLQMKV